MNPGVKALELLVEMGVFAKGAPRADLPVQYWPCGRPSPRAWVNASGLVHKASSWVGKRGLTVTSGRLAHDVIYHYNPTEDKEAP